MIILKRISKEIGWGSVGWIDLVQDEWRALVNRVTKIRFLWRAWQFFVSWGTVDILGMNLFHGEAAPQTVNTQWLIIIPSAGVGLVWQQRHVELMFCCGCVLHVSQCAQRAGRSRGISPIPACHVFSYKPEYNVLYLGNDKHKNGNAWYLWCENNTHSNIRPSVCFIYASNSPPHTDSKTHWQSWTTGSRQEIAVLTGSRWLKNVLNRAVRKFHNYIVYKIIIRYQIKADENCALLGHYTASSGNFLQTFRANLSVSSSGGLESFWERRFFPKRR